MVAAAISVASLAWESWFGVWWCFSFNLGTPQASINAVFSTALPIHWIPTLQSTGISSTYKSIAEEPVPVEEFGGFNYTGTYSTDIISIANVTTNPNNNVTVSNSVITNNNQLFLEGATEVMYLTGIYSYMGLYPEATIANEDTPQILYNLVQQGVIPGMSWAFNAGSYERNYNATLVLGGYDAAKISDNNVTYPMGNSSANYLTANMSSLVITDSVNTPADTVTTGPIEIVIDSTLPFMWLPEAVCDNLASRLNLTWNSTYEFYTLSAEAGQNDYDQAVLLTFTFADNNDPTNSLLIQAEFQEWWWYIQDNPDNSNITYFPLKRAANSSQYILGRAFMQNAYVIADFDRQEFTLAAREWTNVTTLVDIMPPSLASTNTTSGNGTTTGNGTTGGASTSPTAVAHSSGLSGGDIAGIVVGAIAGLALIAGIIFFLMFRRRKAARKQREEEAAAAAAASKPLTGDGDFGHREDKPPGYLNEIDGGDSLPQWSAAEAPGSTPGPQAELPASGISNELQGDELARHELPGGEQAQPLIRHELPASYEDR